MLDLHSLRRQRAVKVLRFWAVAGVLALSACASPQLPDEVPTAYMVFFDSGSDVAEDQGILLKEVAALMRKFPSLEARLVGHRGTQEAPDIDELRVNAVEDGLAAEGVDKDRLTMLTAEDSAQVTTGSGEAVSGNARVEIYLVEKK